MIESIIIIGVITIDCLSRIDKTNWPRIEKCFLSAIIVSFTLLFSDVENFFSDVALALDLRQI